MYDVTFLGNAAVDALINTTDETLIKHKLKKGDFHAKSFIEYMELTEDCDVAKFESGGSVANSAYAMGILGSKVAYIGRTGKDPSGQHFYEEMTAVGVDMPAPEKGAHTMEIFVLITPDGERTFVSPGVTAPMDSAFVQQEYLKQTKWLVVEGYTLLEQFGAVETAVLEARKHGAKIALTLASFAVLESAADRLAKLILGGIDLLIANKHEMQTLLDKAHDISAEEGNSLQQRVLQTPRVITSSGDGATYFNGDKKIHVATRKITAPVDTTGAGDAFAAGFLSVYCREGDVEEALKLGHKLGRYIIMRTGARLQKNWESEAEAA